MKNLLPPKMRAFWISNPANVRYVTGLISSNAQLLVTPHKKILFTDGRYVEAARALGKKNHFSVVEWGKKAMEFLKKIRCKKIGIEEHHMTVAVVKKFKKITGAGVIHTNNHMEKIRAVKTPDELQKLRTAQKITDDILKILLKTLARGDTEEKIGQRIKMLALEHSAEDISFEPIVAFGAHAAVPHHRNTQTKLKKGDMVLIDMGVRYRGYCSDMTRTFFTAKPSTTQAAIYQNVLDAQTAAIKKIKIGIKVATLEKIARKTMGKNERFFIHALGHGVGLDIHELPVVSSRSTEILKENMVITVEPGIYMPGEIGVRIEDMGCVTKNGYENYTKSSKSLAEAIIIIK